METIERTDEMGMAAAEIVTQFAQDRRYGPEHGFGCGILTMAHMKSDYVRLATEQMGITLHVDRVVSLPGLPSTSHAFWVWIERNRSEESGR